MVQEKQSWLKNVFDSEYFVFWMALTCLSRYKEEAVHQYLCYKMFQTRRSEAMIYYPQLFNLMLVENGHLWNRPIFRLLYKISRKEKHFAATLAMYSVSVSDSYAPSQEKYRICMGFSRAILHKKMRCPKPRKMPKKSTLYTRYLKMTYGSKVGMSPVDKMLEQQKQYYMLPDRVCAKKRHKTPSLESAIAALVSGLASVVDFSQHSFLVDVAHANRAIPAARAVHTKEAEMTQAQMVRESGEACFIMKLNAVSNSLIPIPKAMRDQALSTELNLLNLYLPEDVCLSILCPGSCKHRNILSLSVELSKTLDSATRAPFMLVFETSQEANIPRKIEAVESPSLYEGSTCEEKKDRKQETKERIFKTAIKILGGLKELDSSAQVDLDILSIKTRVIRKIYNMHTPQYIAPSGSKFSEEWGEAVSAARKHSVYRDLPTWGLNSLIVKTGSDMKQEQLTSQILSIIESIWAGDRVELCLNPYKTLVTGKGSGLIETILGAKSIHQIKVYLKEKGLPQNLIEYFRENWGSKLEEAREVFFKSLVAYSLVSYILQIKDRHNGNILIGNNGALFHIDFGFVLGSHPGFYSVESAPFKFALEYAEVAGKDRMETFKNQFLKGFLSLRKHMDHIIILVESVAKSGGILSITHASVHSLRDRFQPGLTIDEFSEHVSEIVDRGMKNVFTDIYDSLQYYTQGYCK
ncbi:phosphatidylinositol 4-kinase B [Nematocida major]|uniref:phosphatidylinositol 4-kinase B n=1 Tax=Nematocida major TaxID=1912982 RepID=UPI0020079BF4|nr:phosphatidylinositol 4-kinase B [Nematocida major]KAH9386589.1 phosphatidylinositol 4-kinase B [Nematocida major]